MNKPHAEIGQERYETFFSQVTKKHIVQYDYRHIDGELFSCVRKTLEECRATRDEWLNHKAKSRDCA